MRKISSPFSFLISRLHSAYDLGGTAETEVFGEYYLKPEEEDVEIVNGAEKVGHRGVEGQHKCPARCSA